MSEAVLLVNFLNAAVTTGVSLLPLLQKVSTLVRERHAAGGAITPEDLNALFDEGDAIEAAARKQFEDTLADTNTPHA